MTTLVLAEHGGGSLDEATARAVTAAAKLGAPVEVLVAGEGVRPVAEAAAALAGVDKVLLADDARYAHALAEALADLMVSLAGRYDAFVAPATANGKNVMPRLAALLDIMQVSDAIGIAGPDTFERPIYAGNAVQTVKSADAKKAITIRASSFPPAETGEQAPIEEITASADPGLSRFAGEALSKSERPELGAARVVVSGGRGLGSAEKFKALIEPLADAFGAAVGASRAAVDAGYAPNDFQVGQTGKVVAPELYVAVGISGAIQHLAGMKDSKIIVAINRDEEAPIFQVADYGLVGDLFDIVPKLTEAVGKLRG